MRPSVPLLLLMIDAVLPCAVQLEREIEWRRRDVVANAQQLGGDVPLWRRHARQSSVALGRRPDWRRDARRHHARDLRDDIGGRGPLHSSSSAMPLNSL